MVVMFIIHMLKMKNNYKLKINVMSCSGGSGTKKGKYNKENNLKQI